MDRLDEYQSFPVAASADIPEQGVKGSETPQAMEPRQSLGIPGNVRGSSGDASHHPPVLSRSDHSNFDPNAATRGPPLLSREILNERAQQLIDEINEKRKRDTALLEDFRKALHHRVEMSCSALEQHMYGVYEASGKSIQPKLQDLFATMDRVAAIEEELDQFKQGLGVLYKDIHHTQT